MKPTVLKYILIFVALFNISSCHYDNDSFCDYLPLKVGAKYLYSYNGGYTYTYSSSSEEGECQWEFIDRNPTPPYVYRVRQAFNGIYIEHRYKLDFSSIECDTTIISNQIDTLTFQENKNGTVTIECPIAYWGTSSMTVERYLECSKTDTCFINHFINEICLAKNVGIKSLYSRVIGNHSSSTSYTLIKGPY